MERHPLPRRGFLKAAAGGAGLLAAAPGRLAAAGPLRFQRHQIDDFPSGYQVAVADLNGDGRPDVIALSTAADRVDWYENPTWKRRPVARTARNISLAAADIDGDGRPEIALASGFYFAESARGGEIQWLSRPAMGEDAWPLHPIAVDPVVHRLKFGDLDGDGRLELIHAPLFSRGSNGPAAAKPAHLWAFRIPRKPAEDAWEIWKIDESLTVLHGIYVGDLDQDGRDEILTASFEGIHRFDFEGNAKTGRWTKTHIAAGAPPGDQKPGTARGSSEIVPGQLGRLAPQESNHAVASTGGPARQEKSANWDGVASPRAGRQPMLAAIEPWHGNQVVVYTQDAERKWQRRVLDDTLTEGHALVVADFDGDGLDEIVAGWRGADGGLALYHAADPEGRRFDKIELDRGIAVECVVAADLNLDGRLDLAVIAGRSNKLVWYENVR